MITRFTEAQRIGNPQFQMNNRLKKRLYNIDEAGEYLGRSVWSVRELMYKGTLPYVKVGRRVSFDINDLDRLIEMHKMTYTY